MKNKKYFIMILCIIALFSMQFVCANDNTDNITLASAEDSVLSAPSGTGSFTDLKNFIDGEGNEITLESNYIYQNGDSKTGINITKNLIINGNGAVIDGQNAAAVFNISSGTTVTLKNLTITQAAKFDGNNIDNCLRAITSQGNLNIIDCTFENNKAGNEWGSSSVEFNGSAIYSTQNINIQNSKFINNQVHNHGVIYTTGTLSLNNSYFKSNGAVSRNDGSIGGAIVANNINVIENCTFISNFAQDAGGSIFIAGRDSVTSIKDSTFEGSTSASASNGGAIFTYGVIDLIENSTFKDISTSGDGGAILILNSDSNTKIRNSTFKNNKANALSYYVGVSGGVINTLGSVEIENSTMEDNSATNGGVVYAEGTVTISDSYLKNNGKSEYPATKNAGVVYAKGKVTIENSTFGANYGETGGAIYSESDVDFFNSYANGSGMQRYSRDGSFIYAEGNVNMENSTVDSFIMVSTNAHGVIYTEGNIRVKNSTLTKTDLGLLDSSSVGGAIHAKGNGEFYNSNFTHNNAKQYAALYVGGTLDIYDSLFFNNTHGSAFGEGRAIVNNTNFLNNTGGAHLNGRVIGSNSTLNITNSQILWTYGLGGIFNGTVFSEGNLYIENCTLDHNHAFEATSTGLVVCTHSNATVIKCEFYENAFSGQDCFGGNIYAGQNAYVENCTFSNSTVYGGQGKTHGLVVYAEQNITFKDSTVDDVFSLNSEHGSLTGNYVTVENSNFTNIKGFGAKGAAIHANVANVSNSSFFLVNSTINNDMGGAIYAINTYAYRNNFTNCSAGGGGAIYSENYTVAYENIFINNRVDWAGGAIYTKNGNITYNVIIGNGKDNSWGDLCDVAIGDDYVDSLERNWWGHNRPFEKDGENRAKLKAPTSGSGGTPYLPNTWIIMDFYVTDPNQPIIGQGVNLTSALERYYNNITIHTMN